MVQFRESARFLPEICVGLECDNACLFCAVGGDMHLPTKSLKEIKGKLKEIRRVNDSVRITGGEPTVRKDILKIVSYAKSLGFSQISIETNGRSFGKKEFMEKLIKVGANHFFVSIHGHNAKVHDKVTCAPGSFKETSQGIRNLSEYYSSNRGNMYFGINVVITKFNYRHLPKIVKFLRGITENHMTLNFITVHGSAKINRHIVPKMSEAVPYIKRAADCFEDENFSIGHIPLCFLGEYIKHTNFVKIPTVTRILNPKFKITLESHIDRSTHNVENCSKCRFKKFCPGLWVEYAKIYGYGELKPVRGKKVEIMEELKNIIDHSKGKSV